MTDQRNGITREHVRWAYRLFLDREPENEAVLARAAANTTELREGFMNSAEYRLKATFAVDPDKWVMAETSLGFRIWLNLYDRYIGRAVLHDSYEAAETNLIRSLLKPGDRVIDVGANIGYFTLLMASHVGPRGHVLAFEAMPKLRRWLRQSVDANGWSDRINVGDCGLSDREGTLWLVYATVTTNFGGAYLAADANAPHGHKTEPIPVKPLDHAAEPANWRFIKLDVEGAEPRVIRGATELLRHSKPTILCELHNAQLAKVSGTNATDFIRQMRALGYQCRSVDGAAMEAFDGVDPTNVLMWPE